MKNFFGWLFYGKLCARCKLERTGYRVVDEICTTCCVVQVIKWRIGL